ncbi:GNAT family N-acetyltransferase [Brevibacillus reuszeri]|uniref:GNAT family N-acetyltransferase n=1 Tax=Brevibacillus reuszeri TaxID=54915 RepID=UPI002897FB5E|nr:GNAT family N-acetyltransferase [Brevibacillus reuszeri]
MSEQMNASQVRIHPWSEEDLPLLHLLNASEMTEHLGGPETEEQVVSRHNRYVNTLGKESGCMFRVTLLPELTSVGSVGYWDRSWQGEAVYEIGWSILPAYQGKGIASAAVAEVIAHCRAEQKHTSIHAFPSVNNAASNRICRKLNFSLVSECDFEYPPGSIMKCNDWRLELGSGTEGAEKKSLLPG